MKISSLFVCCFLLLFKNNFVIVFLHCFDALQEWTFYLKRNMFLRCWLIHLWTWTCRGTKRRCLPKKKVERKEEAAVMCGNARWENLWRFVQLSNSVMIDSFSINLRFFFSKAPNTHWVDGLTNLSYAEVEFATNSFIYGVCPGRILQYVWCDLM